MSLSLAQRGRMHTHDERGAGTGLVWGGRECAIVPVRVLTFITFLTDIAYTTTNAAYLSNCSSFVVRAAL